VAHGSRPRRVHTGGADAGRVARPAVAESVWLTEAMAGLFFTRRRKSMFSFGPLLDDVVLLFRPQGDPRQEAHVMPGFCLEGVSSARRLGCLQSLLAWPAWPAPMDGDD